MDINSLALDQTKERDGQWFDHPLGGEDGKVRLRRRNHKDAITWAEDHAHLMGTFRNGVKIDQRWLERECLARVHITDWSGWTEGGEPVPFSHDKASQWAHDPRLELWTDCCIRLTGHVDAFLERQEDEAGKP